MMDEAVYGQKGTDRIYSEDGIQNDLAELWESINSLEHNVSIFSDRIEPILRPEPNVAESENATSKDLGMVTRSLVRNDIWRLQNRVSDLITKVHNLDSRLEL